MELVFAFPFSCKIYSMFWNALPLALICGSRTTELISGLWLNLTGLTRHKIFLSQNGCMYMKIYFYFSEDISSNRNGNWKIVVNWSKIILEIICMHFHWRNLKNNPAKPFWFKKNLEQKWCICIPNWYSPNLTTTLGLAFYKSDCFDKINATNKQKIII